MANEEKPAAIPEQGEPARPAARPGWAGWYREGIGRAVGFESDWVPAWLRPTGPENRLPVAAAIVVAIALQIWLSERFGLRPRWLLPALEIAMLGVLTVINPVRLSRRTRIGRYLTIALAGAITIDNVVSAVALDHRILTGTAGNEPKSLIGAGTALYLGNIVRCGILS